MKRAFILSLTLTGLLGCAIANKPSPLSAPNTITSRYHGVYEDYYVDAEEKTVNGFCAERTIVLQEKEGLHINPYVVDYVSAKDIGCDNVLDQWKIRDPRYSMTKRLAEDIIWAFEDAKFHSKLKKAHQ